MFVEISSCACHGHQHTLKRQANILPEQVSEPCDLVHLDAAAGKNGFDLGNLDRSVRPQDDFYQFAVGGWKKSHPIPDHKVSIGTFEGLAEANRSALHNILESLDVSKCEPGSDDAKLALYYRSGMDQASIDAAGAAPLAPIFASIDSIRNLKDVGRQVASLHDRGISALFGFGSSQDLKNSQQVIAETAQGGLGLPEKEYYFKTDPRSVEIRQAYQQHIARSFQLLGDSPEQAESAAAAVLQFETRLAGASLSMEELRDPTALYHPKTREELAGMNYNFPWVQYLQDRQLGSLPSLNVATPSYFAGMETALAETPLDDVKSYLRWQVLSSTSGALSQPFEDENFKFAQVMSGVKTRDDRWKKIVSSTEGAMGEALGRRFVETKFSAESKSRVLNILHNIRATLRDDLQDLPWMTPATRGEALKKLDSIVEKIGYPDKWQDYSALNITDGPFVNNVLESKRWSAQKDLAKIGKPVDPTEWGMTPAQVNAYYMPTNNEIVFPAGILQPPFFNPDADEAINYGAIGVVIGHEITHGFDDSGAQFDASGNLRDWWQPEDKVRFKERTQQIIDQANAFQVGEAHLNGPVVVGEAIADLGGVELAFNALQRSRAGKPADDGAVDGFTADQRFFLGYAQVWASNTRPKAELEQINTDPHPLSEFRVNGTLANVPEFAAAFGAREGDKMVRPAADRTILWE